MTLTPKQHGSSSSTSSGRYCEMRISDTTTPGTAVNADILNETDINNDFKINEWKHKWKKRTVSYAVISTTTDPGIAKWETKLLGIALQTWKLHVSNLYFKKEQRNPEKADIKLTFEGPMKNKKFRERPSVLAYAYFPGQGEVSGDIVFNDGYIWTKDGKVISSAEYTKITGIDTFGTWQTYRTYNAMHVLIHEIGHGLGLRHNTECKDCVMYPYYNGTVTLAKNDIRRIQGLEDFIGYGKRRISLRIRNYFHNKAIKRFNGIRKLR